MARQIDQSGVAAASDAARQLGATAQVRSLCLLGSAARGEAGPTSDIDILVLTDKVCRPSELLSKLDAQDPRLALICKSFENFEAACRRGSVFSTHVRAEGQIVYDPGGELRTVLAENAAVPADVEASYRWASRELRRYDDLAPFGGLYSFVFARLFAVGRAVAIARSIEIGTPRFGKLTPFRALTESHPELSASVKGTVSLKPFHDRADGKPVIDLPFEHRGAHGRAKTALNDVRALLPR